MSEPLDAPRRMSRRGTSARAGDRLRVRGHAPVSGGRLDLDEVLLDAEAVAERLGLTGPSALRRLIDEERLPHLRIDEPLLFPERDLEAWIELRAARARPEAARRRRQARRFRRFLVTAALERRELVALCNAALEPRPREPEAKRGPGRPRIRATSPNATKAEVVGLMSEAIEASGEALARLCAALEERGVRERLAAEGNARALALLGELEGGLDVERRGPDRVDAAASLEVPGLWEELEGWLEALLEELASGQTSESARLRRELTAVLRLLREGATSSPMVILRRMTLFQLRSLAGHLGLPARRDKETLLAQIAEALTKRLGAPTER